MAFRAEQQRHLPGGVVVVEADGPGAQGRGHQAETGVAQPVQVLVAVHPPPRHRQGGAHGGLDRPPVQRIGGSRRDQDAVPAQRRGDAHDAAEVGVVDEVFAHQQPAPAEQPVPGGGGRALEGGQRPAMDVESADLLDQRPGCHVAGYLRPGGEHVGQPWQPAFPQQEGSGASPGLGGPPDDLVALRDEQPPGGLDAGAQLGIPQRHEVAQASIAGVLDCYLHTWRR